MRGKLNLINQLVVCVYPVKLDYIIIYLLTRCVIVGVVMNGRVDKDVKAAPLGTHEHQKGSRKSNVE